MSRSSIRPAVHLARRFHKRTTLQCRYLLHVPPRKGRAKRWPMILFLHGSGERGEDLEKLKKQGPPRLVEEGRPFPFVLVSPQCPEETWWSSDVLTALLDHVLARYPVDPRRVYLTGLSMGGYGTWLLAAACPERFAAIAPVCGGGHPVLAHRLKDVPVWAFHGAKDRVVLPEESQRMVRAVRRAGGEAHLTLYRTVGHDSWTKAYNDPRLYEWFLSHRRRSRRAL